MEASAVPSSGGAVAGANSRKEETIRGTVKELTEALKQAEVDQDFVWTLWKETRQEIPDVTGIINTVVAREKEKFEKERNQLLLNQKEKEIELEKLKSKQSGVLEDQNCKIVALEKRLEQREATVASLSSKVQDAAQSMQGLEEKCREVALLKEELASSQENCVRLNEEGTVTEAKLLRMTEDCQMLRSELKDALRAKEMFYRQFSIQQRSSRALQGQNELLKKEVEEMKEKVPSVSKMEVSMSTKALKLQNEQKKKELVFLRSELKAKTEELRLLRVHHSRRLERMKALQASHNLTLQQLKTYENHGASKPKSNDKPIRHEDSDRVWNEMTKYKQSYEEMKANVLELEERNSSLESKCAHQKTLLAEFESNVKKKAIDLEEKLTVIASMECSSKEDLKNKELRSVIEKLELENKLYKKQIGKHKVEYEVLQRELQGFQEKDKNKSTAHASVMTDTLTNKPSETASPRLSLPATALLERQDAGTMTEVVSQSSTQTVSTSTSYMESSLSSSPKTCKKCRSLISFKTDSKIQLKHKRSYSDGYQPSSKASVECKLGPDKVQFLDNEVPSSSSRGDQNKRLQVVKPKTEVTAIVEKKSSGNIRHHKCLWQKEVKMLQTKLRSLRQQVMVLNTSKQLLAQQLDQGNVLRMKIEGSLRDTTKQYQALKLKLESLQLEIHKLRTDKVEYLEMISKLEQKLKNHTDSDWKRMEQEQKELQSKCLSLKHAVKSLEEALDNKSLEVKKSNEKCTRLEKDMKQKRALIEAFHQREVEASAVVECREKEKTELMKELESLNRTAELDKQKMRSLKNQLTKALQEKQDSDESLTMKLKEVEKLQSQHLADTKVKKSLDQSKSELQLTLKSQELSYQEKLQRLQKTCKSMQDSFGMLKVLIKSIADLLIQSFSEKQLKANESLYMHDRETDALAGRVREIARTALNLSELELHAFFDEEASVDNILSDEEKLKHEEFKRNVELAIQSRFDASFSSDILHLFKEYISMNLT